MNRMVRSAARSLAPSLVLALTAAAAAPPPLAAQYDAEVAGEIVGVVYEMWEAIEQEDLAAYAAHVHPDVTVYGEGDLYLVEGKDQELDSIDDWMSRYEGIHTEMHQPRVEVRGDVAWLTYYWTDRMVHEETGERVTTRGKSTRIFVREDGRWLFVHGHYTDVP